MSGEFTDEAKKLIDSVSNKYKSPTVSDHVTRTKIHKGFMKNGKSFTKPGTDKIFRYDGRVGDTLYELKPFNAKNIRAAIKQLQNYQKCLDGIERLVLVLY